MGFAHVGLSILGVLCASEIRLYSEDYLHPYSKIIGLSYPSELTRNLKPGASPQAVLHSAVSTLQGAAHLLPSTAEHTNH